MGDDESKFGPSASLLKEYLDEGKTGGDENIISKTWQGYKIFGNFETSIIYVNDSTVPL